MAQFTTSNVSTQLVGRELSIASSFVKQYYTLLNKAPCFIYNFYSHDSTFIYGTIEMANEHYTEPIVGREKIKKKMEDLNLNDCRAKIKQIDCLETLAGGLVIQVIGELSNNGRPMRRFLQTFVLAPSPDENRQDGDSQQQQQSKSASNVSENRRVTNVQSNENSSPSQNQKFFVLNSIFRYQDDAQENDIENDAGSHQVNASIDNTNNGGKLETTPTTNQQHMPHAGNVTSGLNSNGSSKVPTVTTNTVTANLTSAPTSTPVTSTTDYTQNRRKQQQEVRNVEDSERLANEMEEKVKLSNKPIVESSSGSEPKREITDSKVVYNGTGSLEDKKETFEKTSTENSKTGADHSQPSILSGSNSGSQQQSKPNTMTTTTSRPPPSNEPKTYANMVRNAHALSAPAQTSVTKVSPGEQQSQQQSLPQSQQQTPNTNQSANQQQSNQLQQQNNNNNNNTNSNNNSNNNNTNNNSNNNNRRRHMMRKPSNKSTGRSMKNRPPRLPLPQQQQQQHQQQQHQQQQTSSSTNTNTPPSTLASKPVV